MQDYLERGTRKRGKRAGEDERDVGRRNRYRERNRARRCNGK
jgi:hypothetical protein